MTWETNLLNIFVSSGISALDSADGPAQEM